MQQGPTTGTQAAALAPDEVREGLVRRWAGVAGGEPAPPSVVWVDHGDDVLVRLDTVAVRLEPGVVRIEVDLECSARRSRQAVVLAVGDDPADPSPVVVTTPTSTGDAFHAARWGRVLQDAAWAALLDLTPGAACLAAGQDRLVLGTTGR